jgi:dihydropteroate synthase
MGVLNVTPDSFSDGGRFLGREAAMEQALRMVEQGADIVDVGGESTRPGAPEVPVDVEMNRVVPVVEMLSKAGVPAISVDTRKAAVAQAALEVGAGMVNDVSALLHDESMATVCARHGAAVVLMHMRGNPATMQDGPITYDNVVEEVAAFLGGAAKYAISLGIEPSQVLVDPGFGFGKTVRHNLDLMLGMGALAALGFPVVWGPSRKSSLGAVTGVEDPRGRLPATLAACVMAVERGAHVVRVHDVAEVRQALLVVDACRAGG